MLEMTADAGGREGEGTRQQRTLPPPPRPLQPHEGKKPGGEVNREATVAVPAPLVRAGARVGLGEKTGAQS